MQLPIDAASLDDMKYAELQKLAKKIGVKANMKAEKLVKTIREHMEQQQPPQHQRDSVNAATDGCGSEDQAQVEEREEVPAAIKKAQERKGRKGRKGRKTAKENEEDKETGGTTAYAQSCDKTSSTSKPSCRTPKTTTPMATTTNRRTRTISPPHMTTPVIKTTKSHTKSPAAKPVVVTTTRRTHTISPKAKKPLVVTTKRRTHTLSPIIQRVATPVGKRPASRSKVQHTAVTSGGSMTANKVKRKRPASGDQDAGPNKSKRVKREESGVEQRHNATVSPGVKEVLDSLHNGLSDTQLKESIRQAVDRRVQKKSIELSSSKTVTIAGTNIPRFTALAKGLSVTKSVITPGHKDWARIHQRNFEKMESIDVYLKKRDERAQSVSAIKVKEMTQRMRTALNSLKKLKTPPRSQTYKNAKVVKPVLGGSKVKSSLFQSPAPTFVPKVTSVSKMNLQFESNASCKTKTPLPSLASSVKENFMSPKTMNVTFDAKRKSGVVNTKQKSGTTPFVFRGNLNQSMIDQKVKSFDLRESLARKITWKPHRGKLQPFVAPDAYRAPPKEVKVQSRDERRKTAQKHRAGRRLNSQLSRRGITMTG